MRIVRPSRFVSTALHAGMVAGAVSLAIETPIVWLRADELPWAAARMAAAMVLGPSVLSPPTFDAGLVALAFAVHFGLSILFALPLVWVTPGETFRQAVAIGIAFGAIVYAINLHILAPMFFPWFEALQNGMTFFSHLTLGATAGAVCAMRSAR
jgi:hypothetical protein